MPNEHAPVLSWSLTLKFPRSGIFRLAYLFSDKPRIGRRDISRGFVAYEQVSGYCLICGFLQMIRVHPELEWINERRKEGESRENERVCSGVEACWSQVISQLAS